MNPEFPRHVLPHRDASSAACASLGAIDYQPNNGKEHNSTSWMLWFLCVSSCELGKPSGQTFYAGPPQSHQSGPGRNSRRRRCGLGRGSGQAERPVLPQASKGIGGRATRMENFYGQLHRKRDDDPRFRTNPEKKEPS